MKTRLQAYRQSRDDLLAQIVAELSGDDRFAAAWLTGSYSRNEQDDVSDLDLRLVVTDSHASSLCRRQEQVSHRTTKERLALFRKFGEPALIHENNNNAPDGGTFTFVLYSDSAIMIDWTLVPLAGTERPLQSILLFDKASVPLSPETQPEELEQSRKAVAEQWAFFWMMSAVTLKYILRRDDVFVTTWLENLHSIFFEIERRIDREPQKYHRGSVSQFQPTRDQQIETLSHLRNQMQELKPSVTDFLGFAPAMPSAEINTLFSLVEA